MEKNAFFSIKKKIPTKMIDVVKHEALRGPHGRLQAPIQAPTDLHRVRIGMVEGQRR
jgi:hypothetical protein